MGSGLPELFDHCRAGDTPGTKGPLVTMGETAMKEGGEPYPRHSHQTAVAASFRT